MLKVAWLPALIHRIAAWFRALGAPPPAIVSLTSWPDGPSGIDDFIRWQTQVVARGLSGITDNPESA